MLANLLCWLLGHKWEFVFGGKFQPTPICKRCLMREDDWRNQMKAVNKTDDAEWLKYLIVNHFETVQIPEEKLLPTERALLEAAYK